MRAANRGIDLYKLSRPAPPKLLTDLGKGVSGVCLAGSAIDVRLAAGLSSAGGAGQVWWVVSGGATGRSAVALVL